MSNTCTTCVKWSPKNAGLMARHGYGLCATHRPWEYLPPHHTCENHTPAKPDVVEGRIQWLKKLGVGGGK